MKFSTGSLLIGRTPDELAMLEKRVMLLSEAGLRAEYLSATDLFSMESSLEGGNIGGAAFLPDDCQLDAHRTVEFIEKVLSVLLSCFLSLCLIHADLSNCRVTDTLPRMEDMQNSITTQSFLY